MLKIKLYADTADWTTINRYADDARISGFTTNPSLMAKAKVAPHDYADVSKYILKRVAPKPVSVEVLAGDKNGMLVQARTIRSWGRNAIVKIPVVDAKGESTVDVIRLLGHGGIPLNITAVMTVAHAKSLASILRPGAIVSFFAGRVADTGRDPVSAAMAIRKELPDNPLLWASTREIWNIIQAQDAGCSIITLSSSLIDKLPLLGKDLDELTLETVCQFQRDGERYVI